MTAAPKLQRFNEPVVIRLFNDASISKMIWHST